MVFGAFDGLHEGHRHFLRAAKDSCEELVVAVAPDEVIATLKGRSPKEMLHERMEKVKSEDSSYVVVSGDSTLGTWETLETHAPNIVYLGYDQEAIRNELDALGIPHRTLEAHEPERYKSSILSASS